MDAVREFPQRTSARNLREFLGVVNYCHCFLPKIADTLRSLHDLPKGLSHKRKTPLTWTQEAASAFSAIKDDLAQLLLWYPYPNEKMFPTPNASFTSVGDVL